MSFWKSCLCVHSVDCNALQTTFDRPNNELIRFLLLVLLLILLPNFIFPLWIFRVLQMPTIYKYTTTRLRTALPCICVSFTRNLYGWLSESYWYSRFLWTRKKVLSFSTHCGFLRITLFCTHGFLLQHIDFSDSLTTHRIARGLFLLILLGHIKRFVVIILSPKWEKMYIEWLRVNHWHH